MARRTGIARREFVAGTLAAAAAASWLAGCMAPAGGTAALAQQPAPGPAAGTGLVPHAFGRFEIGVPASAPLHGRTQWISHMAVKVRAAGPEETIGQAVETAEAARRASGIVPHSRDSVEQIAPDTMLLLLHNPVFRETAVHTIALRLAAGTVFEVSSDRSDAAGIAAQRAAALDILRATVPVAEGAAVPPGFAIDRAVVQRPFDSQEISESGFDLGPASRDNLYIGSTSNRRVLTERLLARSGGVLGRLLGAGRPGRTIRARSRPLAGLTGEELLVAGANGSLLFQWYDPGLPYSGDRPTVEIRMERERDADADALLPVWDAMLDSLRRR